MAPGGSDAGGATCSPGSAQGQRDIASSEPAAAARAGWPRGAAWLTAAIVLVPLLGVGFLADDFVGLVDLGPRGWSLLLDELHPKDFEFLRPVGFLLFRTELSLFGARAWLFHVSHLALFVLAAALAAKVASRLAGPRAARWTAALALLYPGRMEAVAWVAAMFDLLALLLTSAALLVATAPNWERRRSHAVTLAALCFIAPLAKESAYAIPAVIAAWELLAVLPRAAPPTRVLRSGAALGGAALALGYRFVALGGVGGYAGTSLSLVTGKASSLPEMVARALFVPVNPTYDTASGVLTVLCAAALAVALVGPLFRESRAGLRAALAGVALSVFGLLPALPYLDRAALTWSHSRFLTIAGMGVAVAAGVSLAAAPRRWERLAGCLLLVAWTATTLLNELPWLAAARCRDAMLTEIERVTRSPGQHSVWVAGHINEYRGAQLLGGALAEAVALTLPGRAVRVDSEFLQTWQNRPVGPPTAGPGGSLHVLKFEPSPPRLAPIKGWAPAGAAPAPSR